MKVLHVYAGNLYGGIETLLVTLAKERSSCAQMQPEFALCFEGRLADELRSIGVAVHMLGNVRVSRPWSVWQARNQLEKLLRQKGFDVVICHSCWLQAIFGSVIKANALPLVFWCHDILNGRHWLERWASRIPPDLVIANSRYTQASVPKLYPKVPSEVLYLPVAPPQIGDRNSVRRKVRVELNTPDDAVVIIQASRLERWKGQTVLLSALAQLQDLPNWVCWIAGGAQRPHEAEYLRELKEQARALGIANRVSFLGQRSDVPCLLAAADIHCQPNTSPEPFGIAFVEALYAGLPVVTTSIGGGAEIVDESCGRLVAPSDVEGLSRVLAELIINSNERVLLGTGRLDRAVKLCDPARQLIRLYDLLYYTVGQEVVA